MPTPVVSIDIATALSAKADGDAVTAGDLGVAALINAYASEQADGSIALRSETTGDTGSPGEMSFNIESVATANARSNDYYVIKFRVTPSKTGSVATDAANIWWRPDSSTSAAPWAALHVTDDGVSIGVNKRTNGVSTLDFSSTSSNQTSVLMKYGKTYDVCFVLKKSGTATERNLSVYVDGICVGMVYNITTAITFFGTYAVGAAFPYTANVVYTLTGNIEIYSEDSLEGIIQQSGSSRYLLPLPSSVGSYEYGISRADVASETETYYHLTVSSGTQMGDSWIMLTGDNTSGTSGVTEIRFTPDDAISFSSEGYLHTTVDLFTGCTDGIHELNFMDANDTVQASVKIDDTGSSAGLYYRVGSSGDWNQLASNIREAHGYRMRLTQTTGGFVSAIIKDMVDPPHTNGGFWGFTSTIFSRSPVTTVQSKRTRTTGTSNDVHLGGVRWQHRPNIWLYCDSWTDAGFSLTPPVPDFHFANHIMREAYGSYVAQRNSDGGDTFTTSDGITFTFEGHGGFGHSGTSIKEWTTSSDQVYRHVRGHNVVLISGSMMNTLIEEEANIAAGGASSALVKSEYLASYRETLESLVKKENRVIVMLPIPPRETASGGGTQWNDNQVVHDFVVGFLPEIESMVNSIRVNRNSYIAISRPYAQLESEGNYSTLTWDSIDVHMNGDDGIVYAAAFASVADMGISTQGASNASFLVNSSYSTTINKLEHFPFVEGP